MDGILSYQRLRLSNLTDTTKPSLVKMNGWVSGAKHDEYFFRSTILSKRKYYHGRFRPP